MTPATLRALRLAMSMTQAELGAKVHRSARQVKRYEAGDALIDELVAREVARLAKRRGIEP